MMKAISKIRHVRSKFLRYSRQQSVVYNGQTSELKLINVMFLKDPYLDLCSFGYMSMT